MRIARHLAAGVSAAVLLSFSLVTAVSLPAHADAAAPTITGSACSSGQGVTVAVDFTPAQNSVKIGCAPGSPATIADAFAAAGFVLVNDSTGMLASVDGVAATYPDAYWSVLTSTADGTVTGAGGTEWNYAQVGTSGGPTTAGQAYMLEYLPGPAFDKAPAATLADVMGQTTTPSSPKPTIPAVTPTDSGSALAAAAWIGQQLAGNGNVLSYNGVTDWGKTVSALFALAAAGVGGDQIRATGAAIAASGEAYVGASDQVGTTWPAIANTALVLDVAGLDPTVFADGGGTRDLIAQLSSVLNADGSFGTGDNAYGHALAMLALARTADGVPASSVSWLEAQQCTTGAASGSFGFGALCASPDPDTTALDVQALIAAGVDGADPAVAGAVTWLATQQGGNGGVSSSFADANANSTGLVAQAMRLVGAGTGQAAGFVGGLQISCATVAANPALTQGDVGAIAFDATGLSDAEQYGVDATNADQLQRATVQGLFAFGLPALSQLTVQGAQAGLPQQQVCAAASPTPTPTPTPASSALTSPAPVVGAGAQTGGTVAGVDAAGTAAVLLLVAALTILVLRRRAAGVTAREA